MSLSEFQALIDSVGTYTIGQLAPCGASAVTVVPNEGDGVADVVIHLSDDGWDNRQSALSRMQDIQDMYDDEIVLRVSFVPWSEVAELDTSAGSIFASA